GYEKSSQWYFATSSSGIGDPSSTAESFCPSPASPAATGNTWIDSTATSPSSTAAARACTPVNETPPVHRPRSLRFGRYGQSRPRDIRQIPRFDQGIPLLAPRGPEVHGSEGGADRALRRNAAHQRCRRLLGAPGSG